MSELQSIPTTSTRSEMVVECRIGKALIKRYDNPFHDGLYVWAIVMGPACLNKAGVWENNEWNDCSFWSRCRYVSRVEALETFERYKLKLEVVA